VNRQPAEEPISNNNVKKSWLQCLKLQIQSCNDTRLTGDFDCGFFQRPRLGDLCQLARRDLFVGPKMAKEREGSVDTVNVQVHRNSHEKLSPISQISDNKSRMMEGITAVNSEE
jgi:hypothetical protein